jgi:Septum formation
VRWLIAVAATVLLAACPACSVSGSSPPEATDTPQTHSTTPTPTKSGSPSRPPKPPAPPAAGSCYRLGYAEVLAPTRAKPPSPCSGIHTAATYFVGRYDRSLRVDGKAVHDLESTACSRRFAAYVGGTVEDRRLTMLRPVWFTPTVEQAARGAHWFQCVVIALQGDEHLAFLRGSVQHALATADIRDHYALCGTAEPGSAGFEQRICAAPHSWRALSTVPFAPGPYPGVDQVRSAGQQPCRDAGRAAASDPLSYQWSYSWPTRSQWRAGQTYGVCWAPS